jgi:DNA-binding transcriptional LysR family regulator
MQAISEQGSFAAAARELNVTQSAIGMQVAALEDALGVKLFDRNYRPPRLTRAGIVATRRAKTIVAQYDDLVDSLTEPSTHRGSFRLGSIPTVLTNLVPAALMVLRDEEPDLTINVSSSLSGELRRQVEQRELDAALMHKPSDIGSAFAWNDIVRQRVVVVAPPDAVEASLEELFERYAYIRFNRSAWVAPLIEARLAELELTPHTGAEIESIEAIHLMVGLGFGLSILPDVGASRLSGVSLRIMDFGDPPIYRTVGLLSRRDMSMKKARQIIEQSFIKVASPLPS